MWREVEGSNWGLALQGRMRIRAANPDRVSRSVAYQRNVGIWVEIEQQSHRHYSFGAITLTNTAQ
jgi:hypothetical protein